MANEDDKNTVSSESNPELRSGLRRRFRRTAIGKLAMPLAALVLVGISVAAIAMIFGPESGDEGPQLTHMIKRGDLRVTVTENGLLESAENTEIKSQVRGWNIVIWVIENGTIVEEGDVLVRLDTRSLEEQIDERTKYANWSQSGAVHAEARAKRAVLAVPEYEQGRYVAQRLQLEKELAIAQSRLNSSQHICDYAQLMFSNSYRNQVEVEEAEFALSQATARVELLEKQYEVLTLYTKEERLETLRGEVAAQAAQLEAL